MPASAPAASAGRLARVALPILGALVLGAGAATAAPERVTLLPSGPASIRFAVLVPAPEMRTVDGHPEWTSVVLEGYAHGTRPGEPDLPARSLMVAVPPTGEVRVSGFARGGTEQAGVELAPMPTFERRAEGPLERRVRSAAARPAAPPQVELLDVTWVRDQRVAMILVRPVAWDAGSRRLTVASQIEVSVEVDPAAASAATASRVGADPFEGTYEGALVNAAQGRRWRRPAPGAARGALGLDARPVTEIAGGIGESCLFAGRTWVKFSIPATGFYRVGFGQFRNLAAFAGLSGVPLDSLRMFAWEGDPVHPDAGFVDSCRYREVAIQFIENSNDSLDVNSDEIYFYALGPSDWADYYDPAKPDSVFLNHPYATRNYYYLARGTFPGAPLRIAAQAADVVDDNVEITPVTFETRVHAEADLVAIPNLSPKFSIMPGLAWEKFFWRDLTQGRSFAATIATPGVETSIPAQLRILMWGVDAPFDTCFASVDPSHLVDVTVNSFAVPRHGWNGFRDPSIVRANVPISAVNDVRISVPTLANCPVRVDASALAWIQVRYARKFEPVGGVLAFDSPVTGGNYIYRVEPFSDPLPPRVFDVTDPFEPRELGGLLYEDLGGTYRLSFETVEGGRRRYRILPHSAIPSLAAAEMRDAHSLSATNLRSSTMGADYLVLYYDEFGEAAEALRQWRADHLPLDGASGPYQAVALPVSAIYDQFSGGRMDPGAIRSLLRAAFYNWSPRPAFVTLLGDGSFDFKNLLGRTGAGQPGALVPSFQNGFSIGAMFATDDWMLDVTDNGPYVVPDFYGGRIPATDAGQALAVVRQKVIGNEQSAPLGPHRNRVLLIADDDTQGNSFDGLEWRHLEQTAGLDNDRVPEPFDRAYVYLHKYGYGPGFTKPAAKEAIRQFINDGITMFNFFGHGSPFKLADENVLLDTDAGTLNNADRLALFLAASCDVGKFDDPIVPSLGERMVLSLNGGAVAVVSATELAYSQFNERLARAFYLHLFTRSAGTGQYYQSVGQALLTAKLTGAVSSEAENNQKYQVMGDGATRLNLPRRWVEVDLFACDTCQTPLTDIARGSTVTYRGRVVESPGGAPVVFDGVADLLIEDSAPLEQAPPCRLSSCSSGRPFYYYRAGAMYRGNVRVANGTFQGQFLVPLEAKAGPRAKARAYVSGRAAGETADGDGAGDRLAQLSAGSPPPGDNSGPTINLSFAGGATSVRPDARLQIDLFDASGILITAHNPQNGIIVTVDENTTARTDVTASFRYAAGSYQSGTASFQLPNLASGPHMIRVSAADNLAAGIGSATHRSEATIAFEVSDTPPLSIGHAYLFPNPARSGGAGSGGQFVVEARGGELNGLLRIYTISGKLIRTLKVFGGLGQVQIGWDGLDDEGKALANGTYFFRVQVNARDEQGRSSARQRAVAEGRFVVLN